MKGIQGCTRRKYIKATSRTFPVFPMRSRISDDTWKSNLGISAKLRWNTSLSRKYAGGKIELPRGIIISYRNSTSEGIWIEDPVRTVPTWSWMRFGYSQSLSSLRSHISHVCTRRKDLYRTQRMPCSVGRPCHTSSFAVYSLNRRDVPASLSCSHRGFPLPCQSG